MSVFCSCDPSMPSLMRSLNSSHVVGAVSDVHGVCGLLPSAGLVSSILLSSLFWSSASCAMFGRSKGPNPLRCVDTALCRYEDRSCEASGFGGVCMLDTPPSALTACETYFFSYVSFDSNDFACTSVYGVLLAAIPISFALGFVTKAFGFWVLCRTAVLLLSFGSALSLSIWMLRRCLCVCSRVMLLLQQVGFRILHSSHSSRVPLVLRCILSGWNKDKTSQGKGSCDCSLVRCLMYLSFQVWGFGALAAASFLHVHQVISLTAAACEAFLRIFALVIHGPSSWLGTLGGHDAFVPVFIMLLSVIVGGSIAMRAMALVVCFCTGSGCLICGGLLERHLACSVTSDRCSGLWWTSGTGTFGTLAGTGVTTGGRGQSPHQACQELQVFYGSLRLRYAHVISVG